jgi:REP element-mobilizing transposase RayT
VGEGLHHRRSIRLEGYDYTQAGANFVTLVTAGRVERFGTIVNGEMRLNPVGQMARREWLRLPGRFPGWAIAAFVIMPNHVHGVLVHTPEDAARTGAGDESAGAGGSPVGAQRDGSIPWRSDGSLGRSGTVPGRGDRMVRCAPTTGAGDESAGAGARPHVDPGSLGAVVRAFKSSTTLRYHATRGTGPGPLWQRNYYEHIVRGPDDLERICAYILANPIQWELDYENPDRKSK